MGHREAVAWLDRRLYPDHRANWDDQEFRQEILALLEPEWRILDLGAGAGIVQQMDFRGCAAEICGVDLDERVLENPFLSEAKLADIEGIPYPDEHFHLVFCDNVLEHLERPERVFHEVYRVLRPGGYFLAKTPNKHHYMPLVAQLTPTRLHRRVNRLRGRRESDTFPTWYHANSASVLRRQAEASGFEVVAIQRIEGRPEYLRFNALTYLVGWAYERAVNAVPGLDRFRIVLVCVLRKPAEPVGIGGPRAGPSAPAPDRTGPSAAKPG